MKSINIKFDAYVKLERLKLFIKGLVASLIIATIIMFINFPNMGETTKISGVVIKMLGKPIGEGGNILYLLVKLENGKEVKSKIESSYSYRRGKKVNLDKVEALFFGNPTYRFIGYAKDYNT